MKIYSKAALYWIVVAMLVTISGNVHASVAGRVLFVRGKVQLTTSTGVTYAVKKGDAVRR
ncbi:MAG TPA: hypothetical protein VMJ33_10980 [Gallionella sp.]|nr:hypothetical protein [Gallionella sp.]